MIPEVNPYNNYRGDGVATLFDYDFFIQNGSQLIVEHIDENDVVTRLEENIDYEIVVIEEEFAGYIKFPIEDSKFGILQENETLSLQLTLPFEQISEYGQSSLLDLNSIEFSLDYLTRLCQILKRQIERSIKVNEGSEVLPSQLIEIINNNAIVSTNAATLASKKADEVIESANIASGKVVEIENKIAANDTKMANSLAQSVAAANNAINTLSATLKNNQITNCLTEIPNRINIDLTDGVFTLKKGSVVTVPNGVNVFKEITLTSDMSFTFSGEVNNTCTMYLAANGGKLLMWSGTPISGAGDPENGQQKYNTTANKVYRATSTGALTQVSFPIARVVAQGTKITEILEVFNGFGYIGSTIWAERGVKGLIADGRNTDGTCKNIPFETTKVVTRTYATSVQGDYEPCIRSSESTFYSPRAAKLDSDNFLYSYSTGGAKQERVAGVPFCKVSCVAGVVTSFKPVTAFRAIDSNEFNHALLDSDKAEIMSWNIPDYSAEVALTKDNKNITIKTRGYVFFKHTSVTEGSNGFVNDVEVFKAQAHNSAYADTPSLLMPVDIGDTVKATSGMQKFVFYPMKGAN